MQLSPESRKLFTEALIIQYRPGKRPPDWHLLTAPRHDLATNLCYQETSAACFLAAVTIAENANYSMILRRASVFSLPFTTLLSGVDQSFPAISRRSRFNLRLLLS